MKKLNEYAATLLLILLIVLLCCGCSQQWKIGKCTQWGVCKTVKDSTHIIDSTYLVPIPYTVDGDTASIVAWLECDSARQVILSRYEQTNGKYIRLMKDIQGGKYTVISYLPSRTDTVQLPGKIRIEYRNKVQQTEVKRFANWFWPLLISDIVGWAIIIILIILWIKRKFSVSL